MEEMVSFNLTTCTRGVAVGVGRGVADGAAVITAVGVKAVVEVR